MLMLQMQPSGAKLKGSPPLDLPVDDTETAPFDPTVTACWLSRGRSLEHAAALAAVWRDYPDLPPSAPPSDRMTRGRERIAAMRPINDAISAHVEAERQARNFVFTEAKAESGSIGQRELALLQGRDEHGYDWDRAVAYADGWYAAHAGWNHRVGDNGWASASREAMRHAYNAGFADGGGDTTDLFDAARRANLAALRADNQPRQAPAIKPARPLPSSWAKPDDDARPTRWSRRLLVVAAATLAEVRPGEFHADPGSPDMAEALMRSEHDGLLIVTLGADGFAAGYADDAGHPITADLADAMIADPHHGKALRDLLQGREIDDVLVALQGEALRVLDTFADAMPLCRSMARTRNSALQQRAHLRCWLDRGHAGDNNIGAGHKPIDVPDGAFTITTKTSDGRRTTFSFQPYNADGAARFCDIQFHDRGSTIPNANDGRSPTFNVFGITQGGRHIVDTRALTEDIKPSILVLLLDRQTDERPVAVPAQEHDG